MNLDIFNPPKGLICHSKHQARFKEFSHSLAAYPTYIFAACMTAMSLNRASNPLQTNATQGGWRGLRAQAALTVAVEQAGQSQR
jgi:hypothetical protein